MSWRNIVFPILRLYWRTFQPRTFGVKVLILHLEDSNRILLVRHTYGDRELWNLPGGGFNPKRETALDAASREMYEELNAYLTNPHELCTYYTEAEGKRDTVVVVHGTVTKTAFDPSGEVSEYCWMSTAEALSDTWGVARIARHAISSLKSHHCTSSKD